MWTNYLSAMVGPWNHEPKAMTSLASSILSLIDLCTEAPCLTYMKHQIVPGPKQGVKPKIPIV